MHHFPGYGSGPVGRLGTNPDPGKCCGSATPVQDTTVGSNHWIRNTCIWVVMVKTPRKRKMVISAALASMCIADLIVVLEVSDTFYSILFIIRNNHLFETVGTGT